MRYRIGCNFIDGDLSDIDKDIEIDDLIEVTIRDIHKHTGVLLQTGDYFFAKRSDQLFQFLITKRVFITDEETIGFNVEFIV